MDRYAEKPFLRLLECYVLNAIGKLEESQRMALQQMEPKLRDVYKIDGSWVDIVAEQMDFSSELNEQLRSIWNGYAEYVRRQGLEPDPSKFATQFVDENFPS
ncbi:hypothetical protein GCM10007907_17770 [Chitinimonas prasina]|uniref:Uncharacterized protein n=1 Tax=Chitinimonas prasina TaxID=1434937 RepID=A0ABQ5YH37_9NEIS|nr:hypothetical protein [Chitinimonas prasina]GLR12987.1 hypothetical protein GCM10007907_17770 [Chitinimonas prasina]